MSYRFGQDAPQNPDDVLGPDLTATAGASPATLLGTFSPVVLIGLVGFLILFLSKGRLR